MKIVIFQDDHSAFIDKMVSNLTSCFAKSKISPIIYTNAHSKSKGSSSVVIDDTLDYLITSKNNKIYAKFLDYCQDNKITKAFIPRLHHPEILLSELNAREDQNIELTCCIYGLQDVYQSKARELIYSHLVKHSKINALIIFSIAGEKLKLPISFPVSSGRVKLLYDPIYEQGSVYNHSATIARSYYHLKKEVTYGLYFGSLFYGKGIDILVDAVSHIPEEVNLKIIVAGNPKTLNFEFDISILNNNQRIIFIDKFIPEHDVGKLFRAVDFTVLPYRSTYTGGTSGVFVQSVLAKRPMICPDIYPFNSVVNEYQLGKSFTPDNAKSLSQVLIKFNNCHKQISQNTRFDDYLQDIQSWDTIIEIITR